MATTRTAGIEGTVSGQSLTATTTQDREAMFAIKRYRIVNAFALRVVPVAW